MYNVITMPDLIIRYFSSRIWLGAFILSVVYLFFRVNAAGKRAICGIVIIFFLVINSVVIGLFTILGENDTFYRNLWAIPSIIVIGIAIIDLLRILPRWYLKFMSIIAISAFVWLANQEHIRCRDQAVSTNAMMVSNDTIELADALIKLREDTGKNTLYIVCPYASTIPYVNLASELTAFCSGLDISSSSIIDDLKHSGEEELTGEQTDVSYIMSTCCSKGIDYVIVAKKEAKIAAFSEQGYDPVSTSTSYNIYHCEGYRGYIRDTTNQGLTSYVSYHDENNQRICGEEGYSTVRYIYDLKGNKLEEKYFGIDDELCITSYGYARISYVYNYLRKCVKEEYYDQYDCLTNRSEGYASIIRTYTLNGMLKSIKHNSENGKPTMVYGRIETRYEYDRNNRLVKESFYDENGNLMIRTDLGYASRILSYNVRGMIESEFYYDTSGRHTLSYYGYASYRREYDVDKRQMKERYYGTDGAPARTIMGVAGINKYFDNKNNQIKEEYLDEWGNITTCDLGYAVIRQEYDNENRLVKQTYWNETEEPFTLSDGYCTIVWEYDNKGNLIEKCYLDEKGNRVVISHEK